MFTTGVYGWLHGVAGCYFGAGVFYACRRQGAGRSVLAVGFLLQSLFLAGRGWLGDLFIPNPIFQGPYFLPWCLALIALVLSSRRSSPKPGAVLVLAFAFTLVSIFYAKGMIPPTPKKISVWAILFFISESMAHALFYTAGLFAVLTLSGRLNAKSFHQCLIWGFIAYTVAQVTGAIWSFVGWGNTFSWNARHLGSAAIWTFFAAAIHLRFIPAWKRLSLYLAIAGALMVLTISYGHYLHEMRFLRVGG